MLKKIKFFLKKIIFIILYRDKKIFYRDCYNSLNFGHLIFWNLVRPGRLLTRIRYKRFLFPKKIKKDDINIYIDTKSLSKNEIIEIATKKLKKYGTVVLNQYFNEETLSKFENEYKNYFNMLSYQPSNLTSSTATLPLSKTLADLWFDEIITSIIEKYIKRLPVARNYPNLQSITPKHYSKMIMTIVMMNLLIAIIGDKFEQVMTSIVPSQYKQLCDLIFELETFYIIWNWDNDELGQFLVFSEYLHDENAYIWRSRM